jgi:hypothetical protein
MHIYQQLHTLPHINQKTKISQLIKHHQNSLQKLTYKHFTLNLKLRHTHKPTHHRILFISTAKLLITVYQ